MAAAAQAEESPQLVVVGGGLAGSEAAWQAARRGLPVTLYEMKPERLSPAHRSEDLAELVCSNSLRSSALSNAAGLLKEEMRRLDSLIIEAADATSVPAGKALAVDRVAFQKYVSKAIMGHPGIVLRRELVARVPASPLAVVATGPLTAPELARSLRQLLGDEYLYFYDAIAPTLHADSIDPSVAFRASRYQQGEGDYLNVPLDREDYERLVDALLGADTVPLHKFETALYFEGCLPLEEMARRGRDTLAYGPLKPVGLVDPRTGKRPHAVVQLRQEDRAGELFNLVGCQTKLKIAEQERIFRALPGLSKAVFARYGSVHRNTYVNAPSRLTPTLELRARPGLYLAGQIAGVEGYVESAALGFIAGVNAARAAHGQVPALPPRETAHGSLISHLMEADPKHFQPMNVNYGLFPPLPLPAPSPGKPRRPKLSKRDKNEKMAARALEALASYRAEIAPVDR